VNARSRNASHRLVIARAGGEVRSFLTTTYRIVPARLSASVYPQTPDTQGLGRWHLRRLPSRDASRDPASRSSRPAIT
jgi:hypothetical protein